MTPKAGHQTHREMELVDLLRRLGGSARTSHLAAALDCSEETVRRAAKKLGKRGLVSRVHGGVFLSADSPASGFPARLGQSRKAKRAIAATVAQMVGDGAVVSMDVSSSTAYVAEALRARAGLTIVTNSLAVAQMLAGHNGNRVFMAGGETSADAQGCFGPSALAFVDRFEVDFAILGADGVDPDRGFLIDDPAEAELAARFAKRARSALMVVDGTKFGRTARVLAGPPEAITCLATDRQPPEALAQALARWRVAARVVPTGED